MNDRRTWAAKVGRIFDTRPRVASKDTVWLERKSAYEALTAAIEQPGIHVCLDGPTGVGKTSLVHTYIAKEKVQHCSIMVTHDMTWIDLCRRLIGTRDNSEVTRSGEFEAGLTNGLPTAKFKVHLGTKERPLDDITYIDKLATTWTEHDVAKQLSQRHLVLVVDDLEVASDALMVRVADLCKIMTQYYVSDVAKLVLIGSGDIYVRLHRANSALDERVSQVSLGAFRSSNHSRLFLLRGLEKLSLRHPWNSLFAKEFEARDRCRDLVWEAADGLPKSLNKLGYAIALRGNGRSGISSTDIFECSQAMLEEHWLQYSQEFPEVLETLESSRGAVRLLRCMYEDGVTGIHKISRLISRACEADKDEPELPRQQVESGIDALVQTGFIVRTGKSFELIFVKHPAAAHTLGVVMRDPARVQHLPVPKGTRTNHQQFKFAFALPTDFDRGDGEFQSDDA
jgi:hypothetical protein